MYLVEIYLSLAGERTMLLLLLLLGDG